MRPHDTSIKPENKQFSQSLNLRNHSLKMGTSRTSIKTSKSDKDKESCRGENSKQNPRLFKLSTQNVFDEFGKKLFGSDKNLSGTKKPTEKESPSKDKVEKPVLCQVKDQKKLLFTGKLKEDAQGHKKRNDRELRKLKSKYNNSIGNILREWVNLIYCILILRMNLIKFVVDKFPDFGLNDLHLQKQILLESKTIYKIIRKAQHFSQEQFLYMWSHLDKLMMNRMILKNALDAIQMKESGLRDWKAASDKLCQLQQELEKAQTSFKTIQRSKAQFELAAKEKLIKLENLTHSKNVELEQLVQQITELKNNEVQMRGKILLNMKTYKELISKKQSLINIEKEMDQLKNDQNNLIRDYTNKIQNLKTQVEQQEKQIKVEKEEKKKIKATLIGFGDFSEKQGLVTLHET